MIQRFARFALHPRFVMLALAALLLLVSGGIVAFRRPGSSSTLGDSVPTTCGNPRVGGKRS